MIKHLIYLSFITTLIIILFSFYYSQPSIVFPMSKAPLIHKSVVHVGFGCSGFVIKRDTVLTAAHCVEHGGITLVEFYDRNKEPFKVVWRGKSNTSFDFAILKGKTYKYPPLKLAKKVPEPITAVQSLGYGGTPHQWWTPGRYLGSYKNEWYIVCEVIPGDSGSAVIDRETQEVIGIVYAAYYPERTALATIVPLMNIKKILNKY